MHIRENTDFSWQKHWHLQIAKANFNGCSTTVFSFADLSINVLLIIGLSIVFFLTNVAPTTIFFPPG